MALDNTQATLVTLRALRNLGIQIAIEDFGAGYSALSYVKHYPIDTLKLDRSFVNGLGKEPEDTAIVHAVLAFAKALGLKVTAEGIETAEQIIQLQQLGCEQGQGFYFSRPMPPQMAATIFDTNFTRELFTRELEMKTRPLEFSLIAGTSILPTKL